MTTVNEPLPPSNPLGPQELQPLPQKILDEEVKGALDDTHLEDAGGEKGGEIIIKSKYADWSRRKLIRKFWRMYLLGLLCSTAGLFAGYCDAAHGNVIANKGFIKQFGTVYNDKGQLELNAEYVSWWGITLQTSTLIPQVFTAVITDRYGRRVGCWMYLLGVCVGIIIETFARTWQGWLGAKFMCGWAYGHIQGGPLTLMSELVMPQMRGNVLAAFSFNWALGGFFCAIGLQIISKTAPEKYLHIIYSEWLLVFLFAIACLIVPESPAFLIKKNRIEAAKKSHRRLIGEMDDFDYEHEFAVIVQEVEYSRRLTDAQSKSEWRAVFKWRNLRRCLIPVLPYAGQSLTGATYLNSYTSYFFQLAGLENPFLATVITSLLGCTGNLSAMFLYDRVGRRPLMVYGTIGCCIFNFCVGGVAFKQPVTEAVGAGLITCAALFVFTNAISYGAIGWSAQVEISTPLLRAKSAGIVALVHGMSKILWYWTVPYMLSDQKAGWGAKCGLFFGGLTAIWFIPVFFYFPETMHRNFAALDDLFDRRISERKFHLTETPYDSPEFIEHMERKKGRGGVFKRIQKRLTSE